MKAKRMIYFLAAFLGLAWLFNQKAILTIPAAVADSCHFQGGVEQYLNAAAQNESEDLFVTCGGFL